MPCIDPNRAWVNAAVAKLNADLQRSADTHLIPLDLPGFPQQHLYFTDESVHPSGSLKHRLARSLFLYALVNGFITSSTVLLENSSGSTAVSEAYFARLLGLRFIAVCPKSTSPQKVESIQRYSGEVHLVESSSECEAECQRLAAQPGHHFLDQFTYAERATDYRGNNNIAESMFAQLGKEPYPEPAYVVCGAGTGGTSATLGRYVRYKGLQTAIVVADPENSAFLQHFHTGDASVRTSQASRIEGIGRQRVERSFIRTAVDAMVHVPDAHSMGACLFLEGFLGRRVGASTGTIFCAALTMALHMQADSVEGSLVAILCDSGDRYAGTVYNREWRVAKGLEEAVQAARLQVAALCCPGAGAGSSSSSSASSSSSSSASSEYSGSRGCGFCPPVVDSQQAQAWPCKTVLRQAEGGLAQAVGEGEGHCEAAAGACASPPKRE